MNTIIKNIFCCPSCESHIELDIAEDNFCKTCNLTFNTSNEIVDFRNYENDQTEDFSINHDIYLSKILSNHYFKFKNFNGLHKLYENLSFEKISNFTDFQIKNAVDDALKSDVPLSRSQSIHGYDIIKKINLYENDFKLENHKKSICLENGCGLGFFIEGLSKNFETLLVVDFSMCYLLLAKKICDEKNITNTFLFCGSVENLPIKKNSISLVHSNNVIEHVTNQNKMVKEIYRVLSNDGLLFLLSPNKNSAYFEPHFKVPFYGFIPFKIRHWLIKKYQNRDCREVVPLSLTEIKKIIKANFNGKFHISFIPSKLRDTSQSGFLRKIVTFVLNRRFAGKIFSVLINKIFLGIMPYHVVLAKKNKR